MDEVQVAVDIGRDMLWMTIKLSAPILIIGLIVGLIISVIQSATQLQEQTLGLVPKMFIVVGTIFVTLPWIFTMMIEYTRDLFNQMITILP